MQIIRAENYLQIPLTTIFLVVGTTAAVFVFIIGTALRSVNRQPVSGQEGMIGEIGAATECIDPSGTVALHGSLWSARSSSSIQKGETVRVVGVERLKLSVEKVAEEA